MMRSLGVLLLVGACGASSPSLPADGSVVDAPPVDAPGPTADLVLGGGSVGISAFTFATTRVGTSTTATFTLQNAGTAPTGTIVAAVTGDASYTVDPTSPCAGATLAPSATCDVTVVFAPTVVGPIGDGTLEVTASPGGLVSLDLHGSGGALGIVLAPSPVDFGTVEAGTHTQVVDITNTNTDALPITELSVAGPVYSVASDCGDSIAGGATCHATITMTGTTLGTVDAALTVASGSQLASAAITGTVGGCIDVARAGLGSGTVTSSAGGIACGATCSAVITGTLTLTAAPDPGSTFLGWSMPGCGSALTCDVTADLVPQAVTATFAEVGASTLSIMLAGDAAGEVFVENVFTGDDFTCASDCVIPVAVGDSLLLVAVSPSDVVGWTGACVASGTDCELGAITGDAIATATFAKAPGEVLTRALQPDVVVRSASVDSMNRLVLGTTAGVVALDASGATRWFVPSLPDPVHAGLTVSAGGRAYVDASDEVVVVAGNVLAKLALADGSVTWTADLGANADPDAFRMAHQLALAPDGDIAVQVNTSLAVFTAAGAPHWTAGPIALANAGAVAVDATGDVCMLATDPENDETQLAKRFDATGTALADLPRSVAAQGRASLAFDSTGAFVTSSSGHSEVEIIRTTATGGAGFDTHTSIDAPSFVENLAVVGDDDAIYSIYHGDDEPQDEDGFVLRRQTSAGAVSATLVRSTAFTGLGSSGIDVRDLAVDHTGNVAIVGAFVPPGGFAPPVAIVQIFGLNNDAWTVVHAEVFRARPKAEPARECARTTSPPRHIDD